MYALSTAASSCRRVGVLGFGFWVWGLVPYLAIGIKVKVEAVVVVLWLQALQYTLKQHTRAEGASFNVAQCSSEALFNEDTGVPEGVGVV